MPYRNIVIESDVRLSMKNCQLIIDNGKFSVPLEDINAILIESRQTTISSTLMSKFGQNGITVYFCDEKHMPCSVVMPYMQHSRQIKTISNQFSLSVPGKKNLWKQVVINKIKNQSICLRLCGKNEIADKLDYLSKTVKSGDEENVEATAAMLYFPALFGKGFKRTDESDLRNSCLNYGYAIIRGQVARLLTSYGFLTCMGINHHSELNQFNLADDIMEPFRPVVDLFVVTNIAEQTGELVPQQKRNLFNLLNYDIAIENKCYSVAYAAEIVIQSLSACFEKTRKDLKLPVLRELNIHAYE